VSLMGTFGVTSLEMACGIRQGLALLCGAAERLWVGLPMAAADPKQPATPALAMTAMPRLLS